MTMPPKICYTAAGILINDDKVLLVKHKKLGIWLNPGGHIEPNELPHLAAEREFFEETGVKVRAKYSHNFPHTEVDEFVPTPMLCNLHWVSRRNYEQRVQFPQTYVPEKTWSRGCEQHLNFMYLLEPVAEVNIQLNTSESDDIAWYNQQDIQDLQTLDNIRIEITTAFEYAKNITD